MQPGGRAGPPGLGPGPRPYDAPIAPVRPASAPATGTPRFPALEGLRALSALAVLAYHAGTYTGLIWDPDGRTDGLGAWVEQLNVGVSVFFVLSGFLLFRPFVVGLVADRPAPRTGPYLLRRLTRIFPAYWLALVVAQREFALDLGDLWSQVRIYGLLQVYWEDTARGGLPHAWSLCTELSFYLVLPLWAAGLRRVGGRTPAARLRACQLGCVAWYATGVGTRAWLRAGDHAVGFTTLPANADLFALGMALAVASVATTVARRPPGPVARTLGELPGAAWLAAGCCLGAAVAVRYPYGDLRPTVVQEVAHQALYGLVAVLVVAPAVFGPQERGVVRAVLRWRPLAALGVVSYGVYLWHITVLGRIVGPGDVARPVVWGQLHLPWPSGVVGPTAWWTLTAWGAVGAAVVATASWFALERPLLAVVRRGPGRDGHRRDRTSGADALVSPPD